jgi:hypothetical protein
MIQNTKILGPLKNLFLLGTLPVQKSLEFIEIYKKTFNGVNQIMKDS